MVRQYKPMGRLVLANAQEGPMIRSMSIWYVCETYYVSLRVAEVSLEEVSDKEMS